MRKPRKGRPRLPYERIKKAKGRTVGSKQTLRAVEKGQATVVYVACNAEERVTAPLIRLCQDKGIELVLVEDMAVLGKACGVEVGAAAAAVLAD